MAKNKYSYYVGVLMSDGKTKFVTSVDYRNKYTHWKSGEKAKEFSMSEADSLVFGLLCNFYYAFTVKVPCGIEFFNGKEEEGETDV